MCRKYLHPAKHIRYSSEVHLPSFLGASDFRCSETVLMMLRTSIAVEIDGLGWTNDRACKSRVLGVDADNGIGPGLAVKGSDLPFGGDVDCPKTGKVGRKDE